MTYTYTQTQRHTPLLPATHQAPTNQTQTRDTYRSISTLIRRMRSNGGSADRRIAGSGHKKRATRIGDPCERYVLLLGNVGQLQLLELFCQVGDRGLVDLPFFLQLGEHRRVLRLRVLVYFGREGRTTCTIRLHASHIDPDALILLFLDVYRLGYGYFQRVKGRKEPFMLDRRRLVG
jgi:hypothetical protein